MKQLVWVGASLKEVRAFPVDVRRAVGYALYLAQIGDRHPSAKPLHGFGGAGVLEVVEDHDGDAYRAIYTVRLEGVVYALCGFQKKSRSGSQTPRGVMDLVRKRMRDAEQIHAARRE